MKTTTAQFDYYAKRVRFWAEKYGLHNLHLSVVNEDFPGDDEEEASNTLGWAHLEPESGMAVVGLTPEIDAGTTQKRLDRVAFHEVWEVVLWGVRTRLRERGVKEGVINAEVHDIIRRAETAQFGF